VKNAAQSFICFVPVIPTLTRTLSCARTHIFAQQGSRYRGGHSALATNRLVAVEQNATGCNIFRNRSAEQKMTATASAAGGVYGGRAKRFKCVARVGQIIRCLRSQKFTRGGVFIS
jgi:hypothetical protein